jgi:hypothetical protein
LLFHSWEKSSDQSLSEKTNDMSWIFSTGKTGMGPADRVISSGEIVTEGIPIMLAVDAVLPGNAEWSVAAPTIAHASTGTQTVL